jgi:hypothetical protein
MLRTALRHALRAAGAARPALAASPLPSAAAVEAALARGPAAEAAWASLAVSRAAKLARRARWFPPHNHQLTHPPPRSPRRRRRRRRPQRRALSAQPAPTDAAPPAAAAAPAAAAFTGAAAAAPEFVPAGSYWLMQPSYSAAYLEAVKPKHRPLKRFSDYTGYYAVQALRRTFDLATGYAHDKPQTEKQVRGL